VTVLAAVSECTGCVEIESVPTGPADRLYSVVTYNIAAVVRDAAMFSREPLAYWLITNGHGDGDEGSCVGRRRTRYKSTPRTRASERRPKLATKLSTTAAATDTQDTKEPLAAEWENEIYIVQDNRTADGQTDRWTDARYLLACIWRSVGDADIRLVHRWERLIMRKVLTSATAENYSGKFNNNDAWQCVEKRDREPPPNLRKHRKCDV